MSEIYPTIANRHHKTGGMDGGEEGGEKGYRYAVAHFPGFIDLFVRIDIGTKVYAMHILTKAFVVSVVCEIYQFSSLCPGHFYFF